MDGSRDCYNSVVVVLDGVVLFEKALTVVGIISPGGLLQTMLSLKDDIHLVSANLTGSLLKDVFRGFEYGLFFLFPQFLIRWLRIIL